ncbi:MAG TPA: iron-sulfur cluster insertion protein ErpA [Acidobacteriota bacterium]|nr:iron-sulfur cluster insertion protein ErpA [Acidobacteriota bacterium]
MVTLTPAALSKVKEIMAQQPEPYQGLRVQVIGGGCSGFQYAMAFEQQSNGEDSVLTLDGLKVFVDPQSLAYLDRTEIDYVETLQGSGFKFNNPNVKSTCGCGESFNV